MTWSLVGSATTGTDVASGNVTGTLPTGHAQGDVLLATINWRGTATFTPPTDWVLVGSQLTGDTLATAGIAGISQYICYRGSGTPGTVWTRTAGDLGVVRIACFRSTGGAITSANLRANSVALTSGQVTAAAVSSITGVTPDINGCLLYLGCSGADNGTWSALSTANIASGSWTVLGASFGTNTGADGAIHAAYTVQTTAAATGNAQGTLSIAGRNGLALVAVSENKLVTTGSQTTSAATQSATAQARATVTTGAQTTSAAVNAPASTAESCIPGYTPAGTEDGDTDSATYLCLGTHLYFTVSGSVSGIRFWWQNGDSNAATSGTIKLFQGNTVTGGSSTLLATKAYSGLSGSSGWREVTFDTPISVSANTLYVVAYEQPKGSDGAFHYGYYTGYHVDDIISVSTQIVMPTGSTIRFGETFKAGAYTYGASPATIAPIGSTSNGQFGADVVFGVAGSNIIVVPGGGADFTVTGAQTLTAVATAATATVTATVTAAQTTSAPTQSVTTTVTATVTGAQTTSAATQSATAGARASVTTGTQTTLAATQAATAGALASVTTGAQTTLVATQAATAGTLATVTGAQTLSAASLAATATVTATVTGAQTTGAAATAGTITVPALGSATVNGAQTTLEAATAGTITLGALVTLTVTGAQATAAAVTDGTIALTYADLTVTGAQTTLACVTAGTIGEAAAVVPSGGGASRAYVRRLREAVDRRRRFEEERALKLEGLTLERPPLVPASETVAMIAAVHENDSVEEELLLLLLAA